MEFQFKYHVIDTDLPGQFYGQTALADVDSDGRLEFIAGRRYGEIYWYAFQAPGIWLRSLAGGSGGWELQTQNIDHRCSSS